MHRISESTDKPGRKLALGLILVFIGLAFLADQAGFITYDLRRVLFTWQAFLILLGVVFVSNKEKRATGYLLMFIGVVFIIPEIFNVPYETRKLFWPLILVILGLFFIFGSRFHRTFKIDSKESALDYIDDVNIFGGHERIVTTQNFRGGRVLAIFGGGEYDLRQSLVSKEGAQLEVINVFGGSSFIMPEDWNIKIEVAGIFGGFSDNRRISNISYDKTLIIRGIAVFGGGDIKS